MYRLYLELYVIFITKLQVGSGRLKTKVLKRSEYCITLGLTAPVLIGMILGLLEFRYEATPNKPTSF